jgi:hypothetical protein
VFAGPANTFNSVFSMDAVQQEDATKVMPLPPYALRAGPREEIYFDPTTVTAAIISTGACGVEAYCSRDACGGANWLCRTEAAYVCSG